MSAPTIPALGPSTNNRRIICELNTGTDAAKIWTVLGGLLNFQFNPDSPNWNNNTRQEGRGFQSQNKSGATWTGQATIDRAVGKTDPTTYDPAQEYLRTHAIGKFGQDNTVELRVCEYDPNDPDGTASPRIEAYHGYAGVSWQPAGGDMMADAEVVVNFNGQGTLDIIDHPYPATASAPVVDSASPTALATAGGDIVTINGRFFTGTTAVSFDSNAAASFKVISDSLLVAVTAAATAGTGPLVVTNATGASTTGPDVTYA